MTVTAQTARSGPYAGAGSTGPFAFSFSLAQAADLVATQTDADDVDTVLTLTTDYTVNIVDADSGTVTLVVALPVGEKLTLTRAVEKSQSTDLKNLGSTQPEVLEAAYDKLTQILQDIDVLRSLGARLPVSTSLSELVLPAPEAGKSLTWNLAEDGLENTPVVMPGETTVNSYWQALIEGTSDDAGVVAALALPKGNVAGTTFPGVGDDSDDGYGVGSVWVDTTNDKAYVCLDATVGAAVWRELASDKFLRSDTGATLTAGMKHTVYDLGTLSSGTTTVSYANGMQQKATIAGDFTLEVETLDSSTGGYMEIVFTNSGAGHTVSFGSSFEGAIAGVMNEGDAVVNLVRITSISDQDLYEVVQFT